MEDPKPLLEQPIGQKVNMRVSREGGLEELAAELRGTNFILCNAPAKLRLVDEELMLEVSMNFGIERRVYFCLSFDIPLPPSPKSSPKDDLKELLTGLGETLESAGLDPTMDETKAKEVLEGLKEAEKNA